MEKRHIGEDFKTIFQNAYVNLEQPWTCFKVTSKTYKEKNITVLSLNLTRNGNTIKKYSFSNAI